MGTSILVTGGTGTLGRAVVDKLTAGHEVRVLSRGHADDRGAEWVRGDLRTGAGVATAVAGVEVVVHCATTNGRGDVAATRNLLAAAHRAGRPHVVYVSIAGSDRIPLAYYRAKQHCERLVEHSELPWTILRTTQFHDLVATFFAMQRWSPAVAVPAGVSFQPIDVRDVADRLAALAAEPAAGRVADLGGPQIRTTRELARTYLQVTGRRRVVLPLPLPGRTFRGYREGRHLVPGNAAGRTTFDEFLAGATRRPG
ncbi:uncharacterized protein YbjT (DUF2867 family) [Prauserella sediminis]|uniref:Uncharacterized protein YbjT (DUF2867 family) n=1 Tax=Prauserella sediminis TaxID=577680 RepID=A0A839XJP5_9PSEU|nr:SDR family oxidoreductase [Prauserella sediminis]MBB3662767.1 uncharacterized protein YbjT (DUF2867 family) [Prauserella sediminis]